MLYLKPRNTLAGPGDAVVVPADAPELEIGASLGIVIGRTACRVSRSAMRWRHVAGYVIVDDIERAARELLPAVGALQGARRLLSDRAAASSRRAASAIPTRSAIRVYVDGATRAATSIDRRLDPLAGAPARRRHRLHDAGARRRADARRAARRAAARAGQRVAIEIDGLGRLENRFVAIDARSAA